jgi:hypothetical protein
MSNLRDRLGINTIIGLLLLVALFSLAGDEVIGLVASQVPGRGLNEAFPCSWLPSPEDLSNHQSLVARNALANGTSLGLEVRTTSIPNDPAIPLVIRILVKNDTLGTIPFVYDPDTVIVGDNNTSGLGITFNPPSNIFTPGVNLRADAATYPESSLRILGPQQRCVHVLEFNLNQLDNSIRSGTATVQAYYRGNNSGTVAPATVATPIYPDQGLPTGLIQSNPITIPIAPG